MKNESTIKLICEKLGIKVASFIKGDTAMRELNPALADNALLGFLKSKETLIAVFGEEKVCSECGLKIEKVNTWALPVCHKDGDVIAIDAFKYHAQQMGYELEEILSYYEKYLKEDVK